MKINLQALVEGKVPVLQAKQLQVVTFMSLVLEGNTYFFLSEVLELGTYQCMLDHSRLGCGRCRPISGLDNSGHAPISSSALTASWVLNPLR